MATYIKTPKKTCEICSKEFERPSRCGLKAFAKARFCSIGCRSKQTFSKDATSKKIEALSPYYGNRKGIKP